MPYTIHTAKAKIRDAQDHYRDIDVFSDDLEEALEAIGRDNNSGARGAAVAAVQTIANNINTNTANQLTDASAVANMVAQQFNAANTYKNGDYVRYTTTSNNTTINKLYRLTADHAANVTWENTSKTEVTLSNDVVDLKSIFAVSGDESHVTVGGKAGMSFYRAGIYSGAYSDESWTQHRAATKKYYSFPYDVKISFAAGFSAHIFFKASDGQYTDEDGNKCARTAADGDAGIVANIPKNTEFRIMIRRGTETSGVPADIAEFVSALTITTMFDDFLDNGYPYVTPEMYGAVGNGTTDDSVAFNAAIAACLNTGKALYIPGKSYVINAQIIIPYTTGQQKPLRIHGNGAYVDGQGLGINGGTVLIMNYDTTESGGGKITTLGVGSLEIDGITFTQSVNTSSPYIYTTYTSLFIHNCAFVGTKDGTACNQDAIILGGTTETETHYESGVEYGFQGYGTIIRENYFNHIRRAVYCRVFANGVVIENNCVWNKCGTNLSEGACIEIDDCAENAVQYDCGVVVMGNLIEVCNYVYPIKLLRAWNCSIVFNNLFDAGGGAQTALQGVYFGTDTTQCMLISGFNSRGYGTMGVYKDRGTDNMIISPTSGIVNLGRKLYTGTLVVETPITKRRYKLGVTENGVFECVPDT